MIYHVNIIKLLFSMDDHLFRIHKAEKLKNMWKITVFLILFSMSIYAWMAYLGIGTDMISKGAVNLSPLAYETNKLWFIIGRIVYAILFALLVLFLPAFLYHLLTDLRYEKLIIMQQAVLFVMLIERIVWVPFMVYAGLDWYVSPLSFGIIASYLTKVDWLIYFFGAISIVQLWIIWFQVNYLTKLSSLGKRRLWVAVIFLHLLTWSITALLAVFDTYIIGGWFG